MGRQILAGEVIELPEEGVFFRTPRDGGPHEMLGGGLRTDAIWWALQQIQDELKPMLGMEQAYAANHYKVPLNSGTGCSSAIIRHGALRNVWTSPYKSKVSRFAFQLVLVENFSIHRRWFSIFLSFLTRRK